MGAAVMMDVAAQTDSPEGGTGPARRWMSPQRTATVAAAAAAARYVPSGRRQNRLHQYCCLQYTEPRHTHTHTRLTALCPGLPRWAGTRKVKPIWILLEQETVSGSGISWAICKSAPCSRQITTPAPHYSVFFTVRMPFLPPNQQCQSTEGNNTEPRQTEVI